MEDSNQQKFYDVGQYFQSMSSVAKRLWDDIETCKDSYEDAWSYLSHEEQNQVLNESVIHPEAVLKYSLAGNANIPQRETEKPKLGHKVIEDDLGLKWEDEHSAPFSWFTQSQLNLDKIGTSDVKVLPVKCKPLRENASEARKLPTPKRLMENIVKPTSAILDKSQVLETKSEVFDEPEHIQEESTFGNNVDESQDLRDHNVLVNKNASESIEPKTNEDDTDLDIPRTGFEFLDNW